MAYETKNIIKSMYDAFGMPKTSGAIYMGDLRKEMAAGMLRSMEKILDKHSDKPNYNLMVHTRFDAVGKRKFKTVIMVLPGNADMESYKTLGTMAFYVDNRRGAFKRLWVLPLDRPMLAGLVDATGPDTGIARDAAGMPVKNILLTPR
jgi:hypothetical protein